MIRYNLFFTSLVIASAVFVGCKEEEELSPSLPEVNLFEPDENLNDEETVLRKNFYSDNGVYLIFQDTLKGLDNDGNELIEAIDPSYTFTGDDGNSYRWTLLDNIDDKKKVIDAINKLIIPHIKGGKFQPYSLLPVNNLEYLDYDEWVPLSIIANWRCMIISCEQFIECETEKGQQETAKNILYSLISKNLDYLNVLLDPFHAVSEEFSGNYISEIFPEWEDEQDITLVYECGYLRYYKDYYGDPAYDDFLTKRNDFISFLTALITTDEEEFRTTYGEYDRIIRKYEILKNVVSDMGYIF